MVKIGIRHISSPKPHGMHLVLIQPEERSHIIRQNSSPICPDFQDTYLKILEV